MGPVDAAGSLIARHARRHVYQLTEAMVTRAMFNEMPRRVRRLRKRLVGMPYV